MDEKNELRHCPPPGPPPILDEPQMLQLVRQGWLSFPVPDNLHTMVEQLFSRSSDFFDLPAQEKVEYYPPNLGTEFGYYSVPEEKEYITFRCRVHTAPKSDSNTPSLRALEDTTSKVWQQCGLLLFRILCDLARWSDLDLTVWNDILDGTLTLPDSEEQVTYTLLRLFRYFPTTGIADVHTDLGLLTICIGDHGGLEVSDRAASTKDNPVWVQSSTSTHTATILIGQTLRKLSNGVFNAGVHRVVGVPEGRKSIVYALRHSMRHDVDFTLFGGDERLSAADWWTFLKTNKVNVNMTKDKREAQRASRAALKSKEATDGRLITGQG